MYLTPALVTQTLHEAGFSAHPTRNYLTDNFKFIWHEAGTLSIFSDIPAASCISQVLKGCSSEQTFPRIIWSGLKKSTQKYKFCIINQTVSGPIFYVHTMEVTGKQTVFGC